MIREIYTQHVEAVTQVAKGIGDVGMMAANAEYNTNERVLAELLAARETELREESEARPTTQVNLNVIEIEKL